MNTPMTDTERQKIWKDFLELWPLEKLRRMTLEGYTSLATPGCFTSCLESRTEALGSIWGGSAFKFGIFRRKDGDGKKSDSMYFYGPEYAWRTKLGSTPGEVFARVRGEVVRIIEAIRARDVAAIPSEILWPVVAWKIAFLYQDQADPLVVGVFTPEWLKSYLGLPESANVGMAELNRLAMERRGNRSILEYSRDIWERCAQGARREAPASDGGEAEQAGGEARQEAIPLNCILYGPPGTGKTYSAVRRALKIFQQAGMDTGGHGQGDTACFEKLRDEGRIRFVTFHQSFSYEDFVEGIRPVPEGGGINYKVKPGIFKRLCKDAESAAQLPRPEQDTPKPSLWKMSLGNTQKGEARIFEECRRNNCLLMDYGGDVDFSSCHTREEFRALLERNLPEQIEKSGYPVKALYLFVREMKPGDLVIISEGNAKFRAIGRVGSNYRVIDSDRDDYRQCRDVEWLYLPETPQPVVKIYSKNFSEQTLHRVTEENGGKIDHEALESLLAKAIPVRPSVRPRNPYVLIIDEINRGNLAAIFGELITLIEKSHRADGPDPLCLTLPYSRKPFSVPGNVYIIGTMNTADRSLTRLDTALRRRFSMEWMPPQPKLLEKVVIPSTSVSLADILTRMNERIAVLLDMDHCIGHAPFMGLIGVSGVELLKGLQKIFREYVVPLLEEYFFDDWRKIGLVLNDQRKPAEERMLRKTLEGAEIFGEENLPDAHDLWEWNKAAFLDPLSYAHIADASCKAGPEGGTATDAEAGATA
ncbi:MAG: AAA domain-containing protein [Desulfovibrio sp.]|nr:AAA domain-containing protein [Desulfovibrio sp.]